MIEKKYTIGFNTPAFLGGADQHARFRTPPFKHLIRQWWRVLKAKEYGYDHRKIREAEGRIFGHSDLKNGSNNWAMKSQVRITLSEWQKGNWQNEIKAGSVAANIGNPNQKLPASVYMGYGAVEFSGSNKGKPVHPSLDASSEATLTIQSRSENFDEAEIDKLLYLINWLGTIGSRSTNAWGSLFVSDIEELNLESSLQNSVARKFSDGLNHEWCHAIGSGKNGAILIWYTKEENKYEDVMVELARIKVAIRKEAKSISQNVKDKNRFGGIHLLGLPTNAKSPWKLPNNNLRWPCQIKMKVYRTQDNIYQGVIYHMPHSIPKAILENLNQTTLMSLNEQENFWLDIHQVLNKEIQT